MELMVLLILIPPSPLFLMVEFVNYTGVFFFFFFFFSRTSVHPSASLPMTQGYPLCFDSPPLEETILSMTFLDV
jgi:hypothetical protein